MRPLFCSWVIRYDHRDTGASTWAFAGADKRTLTKDLVGSVPVPR
ncbi:hypothetical protein [Archangium violaceum]